LFTLSHQVLSSLLALGVCFNLFGHFRGTCLILLWNFYLIWARDFGSHAMRSSDLGFIPLFWRISNHDLCSAVVGDG
jgi:hypothetical protein